MHFMNLGAFSFRVESPLLRATKQDMGLQLHHLTVLLWVFLSANAKDCVYKECDCTDGTIDCGAKGLTKIPQLVNLFGAQRNLVFSDNMITEIPANSLPNNLSEVYLIGNPTTTIADTAFDGSVYTIKTIFLTLAHFTRIPNAFGHLRDLKILSIEDVNVKDWNEDAMRIGGQTLTTLNLDNVSLSSWPNWIQNCSQLTEMTLTHGSLQSIPDGALDKVSTRLISLDLSNNNLTAIPKALSQLVALSYLNLEHNNIIDVTFLPQNSKLAQLYLNYNKITNSTSLSDALRQAGSNLNDIGTNYNRLTTIPDFSSLTKIRYLDYSHNKISDPFSGSIPPSIDSIDFSYNFLPALPRFVSTLHQASVLNVPSNLITSFVGTDISPSVTLLDLGYNLITEITDNSFPNNSQLGILRLNNNPIDTISQIVFEKLPLLTELYLGNTRLTRLPLGLRSLTGLEMLDLTEIDGLVCTCMENSLRSLIVSLSAYQVSGKCGVLSIYDFFSQLSPGCPIQ